LAQHLIPLLGRKMKKERKIEKAGNGKEAGKMKKVKKAVGYVCEIPIPGTEMVITKEEQLNRIQAYAAREGIELAAVYGDGEPGENFAERAGVKAMLAGKENADCVLVERVWTFGRKMAELKPFVEKLERKNMELVAATCLWDCVSQQIRHRYIGALAEKQRAAARAIATAELHPVAA
jgi:DNA invertase Pin-like site-specific DNA recombinase